MTSLDTILTGVQPSSLSSTSNLILLIDPLLSLIMTSTMPRASSSTEMAIVLETPEFLRVLTVEDLPTCSVYRMFLVYEKKSSWSKPILISA